MTKEIEATSEEEAKENFEKACIDEFSRELYARGETRIKTIEYKSIIDKSEMNAIATEDMMMKKAHHLKYSFMPTVFDEYEKNDGFCVFNSFVRTYSEHIKTLDEKRFMDLCYRVRGIDIAINSLDKDIVADDEDSEQTPMQWQKSDGVSPKMLMDICKILHISHYAYDATNKCFLKYVSPFYNYPALVYYCVNNHMYHIQCKSAVKELVSKTLKIEHKLSSCVFQDAEDEKSISIPNIQLRKMCQ